MPCSPTEICLSVQQEHLNIQILGYFVIAIKLRHSHFPLFSLLFKAPRSWHEDWSRMHLSFQSGCGLVDQRKDSVVVFVIVLYQKGYTNCIVYISCFHSKWDRLRPRTSHFVCLFGGELYLHLEIVIPPLIQ